MVAHMLDVTSSAQRRSDCAEIAVINRRSQAKLACPPPDAHTRTIVRATKLTDAATYTSVAVVDYKSEDEPDGASMVLYRKQGEWTMGHLSLPGPSVKTDDTESREESPAVIDRYLTAVRRRQVQGERALADALRANPKARPVYMGGTESLGFYRLDVDRPEPLTFNITTTVTPDGSRRVLDAFLGTRGV